MTSFQNLKKGTFITVLVLFFASIAAYSQPEDQDIRVINDPLFWRYDLRLTKKQIDEIDNVNEEFYVSLVQAMSREGDSRKSELSELLQKRSNSIWIVLTPRQKSKWRKIEQARYTVKSARGLRSLFI